MVFVEVGADHLHAAGVDQRRDAAFHAGFDHVLRSCDEREHCYSNGTQRNLTYCSAKTFLKLQCEA